MHKAETFIVYSPGHRQSLGVVWITVFIIMQKSIEKVCTAVKWLFITTVLLFLICAWLLTSKNLISNARNESKVKQ